MIDLALLAAPAFDVRFKTSLTFFLVQVPYLLGLMGLAGFGMAYIQTHLDPGRVRAWLAGGRAGTPILAGALGVISPFCSCSAVPVFIGMLRSGVPLGVTLTYLVASPMVNEVALVLLFATFGWKVATLYALTGLTVAVASGAVLEFMGANRWVEPWVHEVIFEDEAQSGRPGMKARFAHAFGEAKQLVRRMAPYVALGAAVGAVLHGYVPERVVASLLGGRQWWSVPLAVALGVPIYTGSAAILPLVNGLLAKGAALGSCLAFMMAAVGLSLPEALILRKVLRLPLVLSFFGVVAVGIVCVGYLLNVWL